MVFLYEMNYFTFVVLNPLERLFLLHPILNKLNYILIFPNNFLLCCFCKSNILRFMFHANFFLWLVWLSAAWFRTPTAKTDYNNGEIEILLEVNAILLVAS